MYTSTFETGLGVPVNDDGADSITDLESGDAIQLDGSNPFATGQGSLTNNGAVTNNSIDISNDGTDTTIIFDLDTGAGTNALTVTIVGQQLTDANFTFNSGTDELTLL